MPLIKRVSSAMLFPNGMLCVFDTNGQQIPELQGSYSIDKHKRILLEATDKCEFKGFGMLPNGFYETANGFASHFRFRNMSMDEINEL